MLKFLLSLWPAMIPLAVYLLWRMFRQGKGAEDTLSAAESRLWMGTLILSLVIAAVCIVAFGASTGESVRENFVPAYQKHKDK